MTSDAVYAYVKKQVVSGKRMYLFFDEIQRIRRSDRKIDTMEVDFIAANANEKKYIQVTESMNSEDIRKRELAPLQKIRDNYEKIVLSLEPGLDSSYEGIKSENMIEWLLVD